MRKYKFSAILCIFALILSMFPVTSFAEDSIFPNGVRKVRYLEDLDIFAIVGQNGVITSKDGYNWSKRLPGLGETGILDIVNGNGITIMSGTSATKSSLYVSDDCLNTYEEINTFVDKGDGEKKALVVRPEMVYDKSKGMFFSGALEVVEGALYTYQNVGLYMSDGKVENGEMLWQKVDMQGFDLYIKDYVYESTEAVKYPLVKFTTVYAIMHTDGNGHLVMSKPSDSYINIGRENSSNASRLMALADVSSENSEEWAFNRIQGPGNVVGLYIDEYSNIIMTKSYSTVDRIFKQAFDTAMGKTTDGGVGASQIAPLGDSCPAAYHERFASDGKYLISFPSGTTDGSTGAGHTADNCLKYDVKIVSYAEDELMSKYSYVVNNAETTADMLGSHAGKKYFANIACNNDGVFVTATGYNTYSVNNKTLDCEIYTIDTKDFNFTSDDKDAAKVDRTDCVTKTTVALTDVSSVIIAEPNGEVNAGDEIAVAAEAFDYYGDSADATISYEIVKADETAEKYIDYSTFASDGIISVKDDFVGEAKAEVTVRATAADGIFAEKNVVININNPVEVSADYDYENLEAVVTIDNNTSLEISGYAIVCIKDADGIILDYAVSKIEDDGAKVALPEMEYEGLTVETYILNNMYIAAQN